MSDLKFVPRGNSLTPVPGHIAEHGAQPKRICAHVKLNKWQISPRPHVASTAREEQLLIRLCQKGAIAPYDKTTASACGVKFEPLEWRDGDVGWIPATKPKPEKVSSGRSYSKPKDD